MTAPEVANPSKLKTILRRVGNWLARLVEPAAKVTEPGTRRQVQLLSSFVLALVVLLILSILSTIPTAGADRSTATLVVVSIILLAAYLISRTAYYQWATILVVVVFSLAAFATAINDPSRASAAIYSYLPIAFLIAGFLLPIGLATLTVVVDTTIIFLLPLVISNYPFSEVGRDGGIMMTLGALILIFSVVRNLSERDRLAVLTRANQTLQELQGSLEERVEERTAQLRASAEVGRVAASILDTEQLLQQTVNLITERFGFYYAAIFTPDPASQYALLRAGTGEAGRLMKERQHRLAIGGASMVGTAIETRKPKIARQIGAGVIRFANPLLSETQSEVALPLIVGSRVLGALNVQAIQPDAFDENTVTVLQNMADQIAVALSNSALFEQSQFAFQQAQRLFEARGAIAEADNPQAMLEVLLTQATPEADRGLIVLYGPKAPSGSWAHLEIGASWARYADDPAVIVGTRYTPKQLSFINNITLTRPLVIADAARPDIDADTRGVIETLNLKAAVGVGLVAGTVPLGVLFIAYREPRPMAQADVHPLQTLAGQIGSSLYNQRLARETQAALKQLDEINRRLTGEAWRQYTRTTTLAVRQLDVAPGLALDEAPRSTYAQLTAPITLRNTVIGNLRLDDPDRVWTPDDQALLETVASELSIAVENARLIEETERRAERERLVADISSRMFASNDMETIVQIAGNELGRILHLSRTKVRLETETLDMVAPAVLTANGTGQAASGQAGGGVDE
jgi:GAF domain-containing protein